MMWVVENLQEELLTADEARMAADQQVQARSKVVQGLQVASQTPFTWSAVFSGLRSVCCRSSESLGNLRHRSSSVQSLPDRDFYL